MADFWKSENKLQDSMNMSLLFVRMKNELGT